MKLSGETQAGLIYSGELELLRSDGINVKSWKSLQKQMNIPFDK